MTKQGQLSLIQVWSDLTNRMLQEIFSNRPEMWLPWFFPITWASQAIRPSIYLIDTTDEAQSRLKREKDKVWEREWEWEHRSKLKQTSFVTLWIKLAFMQPAPSTAKTNFSKGVKWMYFSPLCYTVFYRIPQREHKRTRKLIALQKTTIACESLQAKLLKRTGNHFYVGDQQDLTLHFS